MFKKVFFIILFFVFSASQANCAEVVADMVSETTSTTGTGPIALLGARTGYRGFVPAIGNGNTCDYQIKGSTGEWEVGKGTVTDGNPDTLSRNIVYSSSNGGSKVNFSTGVKIVSQILSANNLALLKEAQSRFDNLAAGINGPDNTFPVFLIVGQSNAVRMMTAPSSTYTSPAQAYEYDGVLQTYERVSYNPIGTITTPSHFPSFCSVMYSTLQKPFGLIDGGVAGSAMLEVNDLYSAGYWWGTSPLYDDSIVDINAALSAFSSLGLGTPYLAGIIFCQGETDSIAGESSEDYQAAMDALFAAYRAEYGGSLPIFIVRTGARVASEAIPDPSAYVTGFANIRAAQDAAAAWEPYTYMVYTATYPTFGLLPATWFVDADADGIPDDGLHYSDAALNDIGSRIAKKIEWIVE